MQTINIRESAVTLFLIFTCILGFAVQGFPVETPEAVILINKGANFTPLSSGAEPWRMLTSIFLHGGILHLILNMTALYILGSTTESRTGHFYLLVLFILSGLFANIISMHYNFFTVSVGASGAIFGLFGFHSLIELWENRHDITVFLKSLLLLLGYLLLTIFLGNILPFDNAAHLGGFCFGLFTALLFLSFPYFRLASGLIILIPVVWIFFFTIPDTQKIHFDQFQLLMGLESQERDYQTDEEAADAYSKISLTYDSLGKVLTDSLPNMNPKLAEDRKNLSEYTKIKSVEANYMANLIYRETYRYLDSLELVRSYRLSELNYPLSMEYNPESSATEDNVKQDLVRVFYDSAWREIFRREQAVYYRIGYRDSLDRWNGRVEDYYKQGAIQMKGTYTEGLRDGIFRYYFSDSTYDAVGRYEREYRTGKWEFFHENGEPAKIYIYGDRGYLRESRDKNGQVQVSDGNGTEITYYKNGNIKSYTPYKEGLREGRAYGLYPDGKIQFQERYENGRLILGESYEGNNTITYDASSLYPTPVNGMDAFRSYINNRKKNVDPGEDRQTVRLLFSCNAKGEIYDIRVLDSANPYYDELAIKWLKEGPDWNPAREHGSVPVTSEGIVDINF
ncbi:rhomboid family intramembrane serine protease [Fulvivirga sedimenti]|uniref:Rhomboid family intramembrane serine protease n=1 Tax=Fulvivirga sedimenti TaxID=2879465 RepID=A0A9X1HUB1_9BACT|nr:rhomboid family intramembrane serine protease [Fulvivirga sedimenti]MCA6078433.1 rhomboid family intramembrane serine protease [Fulvivirga sedimenti]